MTKQYQKIKRARSKADKEFHLAGFRKWGNRCLLCGQLAVCCHHFKEKGAYGLLRYNLDNAVPVCKGCHFKIHNQSALSIEIKEKRGDEWYERIMKACQEKKASYINLKYYQEQYEKLTRQ